MKVILKCWIPVIILSGSVLSGCSRKENVLAYVGNQKITVNDFTIRVRNLPDYLLGFISTQGGKRQYLSGMIKEEVLLQKAHDLNLHKREDVALRIEEARREVLLAAIVAYLQEKNVRVSDQEIRDYYNDRESSFMNPEQIKVSHILLSDEKTADEVLAELNRGISFETLAREYSVDTVTAINGGDLGYFGQGDIAQPEFEQEVFKLKQIGDESGIIKTPYGYHIAKLTGRRRGSQKTFEEAKEEIADRLSKEKFNSLIEDFRNDYNVRVDYNVLDDIVIVEESPDSESAQTQQ